MIHLCTSERIQANQCLWLQDSHKIINKLSGEVTVSSKDFPSSGSATKDFHESGAKRTSKDQFIKVPQFCVELCSDVGSGKQNYFPITPPGNINTKNYEKLRKKTMYRYTLIH